MAERQRALKPGEIRGRVLRVYRVDTVDEIDDNLRKLNQWLREMIIRAPEFGESYLEMHRQDCNALLDARNLLRRKVLSDIAGLVAPPPRAARPSSRVP
jgi:hypothetical protein